MMRIPCPHCGPRDEDEFVCWSAWERPRPHATELLDDAAWADYVYARANPRGPARERWYHARGCGRWILVERDTLTHEIHGAEPAPADAPAGTGPGER